MGDPTRDWDLNIYAKPASNLASLDENAWKAFLKMTEDKTVYTTLRFAALAPKEIVVDLEGRLSKGTDFQQVVKFAKVMRDVYEAGQKGVCEPKHLRAVS